MSQLTIAIADDEALFRTGLKMLMEDYEGFKIIMEAQHGQDLLDQLAKAEVLPEVLLLDLKMPVLNGIETAKQLREKFPSIRIIVLSTHFSKAFILNMIEIGAASYLPKNSSPDEVAATIRAVANNGFHYNNQVMEVIRENMMNKNAPKPKAMPGADLTTREKEVLQLICEEYTTAEIAEKLYISPRTVDGHRNNLLAKLGCRNTAGLVVHALQNGLVKINRMDNW